MKYAPLYELLIQTSINTDNKFMTFSDSSWKYFQTLAEVQEHISYFINVGRLTMGNMFQDQFLNQVQKLSTMQHVIQKWL